MAVSEIDELRRSLEENEQKLELAGSLGSQLLSDKISLQNQLTSKDEELNRNAENFAQEKFKYESKIEQLTKLNSGLDVDCETASTRFNQLENEQMAAIQDIMENTVKPLKFQLSEAKAEIDAYDIKIDQGRLLVADLRATIKELREQKSNQTLDVSVANITLQQEISDLEVVKNTALAELEELKVQLNACSLERKMFENKWKSTSEDLKMSFETVALHQKTIEDLRIETMALQSEVMSYKTNDRGAKGNSLFSEVEDRRIVVEKEMLNMQAQSSNLKIQNKQYALKIKKQQDEISVLNRKVHTSKSDNNQANRLVQQLKIMNEDIPKIKKKLEEKRNEDLLNAYHCPNETEGVDTFISWKFEEEKKNTMKLEKQISHFESQVLSLHSQNVDVEVLYNDTNKRLTESIANEFKLKQKIEELILKYESNKLDGNGNKAIDDDSSVSNKENKSVANGNQVNTKAGDATSDSKKCCKKRPRRVGFAIAGDCDEDERDCEGEDAEGAGGEPGDKLKKADRQTKPIDSWDTDNEEEKSLKMKKKKKANLFDLKSITKKVSDAPNVKNTTSSDGKEDCCIQ